MAVAHLKDEANGGFQIFIAPAEMEDFKTPPRTEDGLTTEVFRTRSHIVVPDMNATLQGLTPK